MSALNLPGSKITDDAIPALRELPALAFLDLNDTKLGEQGARELAKLKGLRTLDLSRTEIFAPGFTSIDGIVALRPFSRKCPWRTSWRASAREVAKPMRNTTLSRRRSSSISRFSPVRPFMRVAAWRVPSNCRSSSPYMRFTFCFSRSWRP